jgi:hypothetical protein
MMDQPRKGQSGPRILVNLLATRLAVYLHPSYARLDVRHFDI